MRLTLCAGRPLGRASADAVLPAVHCTLRSSDGVMNGGETDVDCGGVCPPCINKLLCQENSDCQSRACLGAYCVGGWCNKGVCGDPVRRRGHSACARSALEAAAVPPAVGQAACMPPRTRQPGMRRCRRLPALCRWRPAWTASKTSMRPTLTVAAWTASPATRARPASTPRTAPPSTARATSACPRCAAARQPRSALLRSPAGCAALPQPASAPLRPTARALPPRVRAQPARCDDGLRNGGETDVDCGGPICGPCDVTQFCKQAADCATGVCKGYRCQPKVRRVRGDASCRFCSGQACLAQGCRGVHVSSRPAALLCLRPSPVFRSRQLAQVLLRGRAAGPTASRAGRACWLWGVR